jgi:hypothetical protein
MSHRFLRSAFPVALAAAALALMTTAARAQDVGFNAMPGIDFAKYKTYAWVQIQGEKYPDDIMDTQIKTAIDSQLGTKGFTKASAETADVLVGYHVAVDKEQQLNTYSMGGPSWGFGPGYYGYGYGGGSTTSTTSTIHVGTLGLDMYDRAAKQLVWRGMASKTLDPKAKPEKRTKNLTKAVTKMLKNYPPPAKK